MNDDFETLDEELENENLSEKIDESLDDENDTQLEEAIHKYQQNQYGKYLKDILDGKYIE